MNWIFSGKLCAFPKPGKSQGSGLLQLCLCLNFYWNNFNGIFNSI